MSELQVAIFSLSGDLKRVGTFIKRESIENVNVFAKTAKSYLDNPLLNNDKKLGKLVGKIKVLLEEKDSLNKANKCIRYSLNLERLGLEMWK